MAAAPSFGQTWQWAKDSGGVSFLGKQDIGVDASGNSHVAGYFSGSVSFGPFTLTSKAGHDVYVVKYGPEGNVIWARQAEVAYNEDRFGNPLQVAVDAEGNTYVSGRIDNTATFGPVTLPKPVDGQSRYYVVKYSPAGELVWARIIGSSFGLSGLAVDGEQNIYITGYISASSATFGTIEFPKLTSGENFFIAKYNAGGFVEWARIADKIDYEVGQDVAADAEGNVYAAGWFFGTVTFGTTTLTSGNNLNLFVVKYDTKGNAVWASQAGGTHEYIYSLGITADGAGGCLVTGPFNNSISFGPTTLVSLGEEDAFIAKYDEKGLPVWARQLGGPFRDFGLGIVADNQGNSYITGAFGGSVRVGSTTLSSRGEFDAFVLKLNAGGEPIWVSQGGGPSVDAGSGIGIDAEGNAYIAGIVGRNATFGEIAVTTEGTADVFIAKVKDEQVLSSKGGGAGLSPSASTGAYPNPFAETVTFTFTLPDDQAASMRVYDPKGREVATLFQGRPVPHAEQRLLWQPEKNLPPGIYFIRFQSPTNFISKKVVLIR